MFRPLAAPAARLHRWSVESQLGSRRNAMTASTVLAARRAEREDVEDFLRDTSPSPSATPAPSAAHG